jgi:hypothetical protein
MRDRSLSADFLSSISNLPREEKIRELYARMTGLTVEKISDMPTEALLNFLRQPDYSVLLDKVLRSDSTDAV